MPRYVAGIFSIGLTVIGTGVVSGQVYPSRPLRIIAPAAGGSSDITSRLIAQELSGTLGQQMIVDNRPPNVGPEIVAKAPPDGHTLLEGGSAIWLGPLLQDNVPWDVARDFAAITTVEWTPNVLIVHPTLPVKSVKELIALAKSRPGQLNYATASAGGSAHLSGELFKSMAGINIVWVPYKGAAAVTNALLGGEVQMNFGGFGSSAPHIKSGKLRALATTGPRPSALFPDLPLVASSLPGFETGAIDAILVPAKTPAAIIRRLNQEIVMVLNRTDVKAKLLSIGTEIATSSPEECAALLKSEIAKWGKLIKDVGIRGN